MYVTLLARWAYDIRGLTACALYKIPWKIGLVSLK